MIKKCTPRQVKAIKTLSGKLGLTAEEEDAMLNSYGVDSCAMLNILDASSLISALSKKVKSSPQHRTPSRNNAGHARDQQRFITDMQIERVEILMKLNGWNEENLTRFITRQTGKLKAIQMLTKWEGVKLVVGLSKVYAGANNRIYQIINNMTNEQLKTFSVKSSKEAK